MLEVIDTYKRSGQLDNDVCLDDDNSKWIAKYSFDKQIPDLIKYMESL